MKRTIATIATAVVMTLSFSSYATTTINPLKTKKANEILLTYVEATSIGNLDLNKYLFTEDFQYTNTANKGKYGKKEYLEFLKINKGINYNCTTSYEILDQTSSTAMAKSIMKFENFTRVDHITLEQSTDGWKISKVITSYK